MIQVPKLTKKDLQHLKLGMPKNKNANELLAENVLITGDGGDYISLVTTDWDTIIVKAVRSPHTEPFRVTVPLKVLTNIATVDDFKIRRIIPDKDAVEVSGVLTDFSISYKELSDEYPESPLYIFRGPFQSVPSLSAALSKAVDFVSPEPVRYATTGVHLLYENGTLRVVSTNGKIAYIGRIKVDGLQNFEAISRWKPGEFKADLAKTEVGISIQDKWVGYHLQTFNTTVWRSSVDGKYPNIEAVIPTITDDEMVGLEPIDKNTIKRIKSLPAYGTIDDYLCVEANGNLKLHGFGGMMVELPIIGNANFRTTWRQKHIKSIVQYPIDRIGKKQAVESAVKVTLVSDFDETIVFMPVKNDKWVEEGVLPEES